MRVLLGLIYIFGVFFGVNGSLQSVGAKGKFLCNGSPAEGVRVELYDEDRCKS